MMTKKMFFLAGRASSACCKIHLKNVCCTNTIINQAVGGTNKGGMFLKINKRSVLLTKKKVMMRFEKSGCFYMQKCSKKTVNVRRLKIHCDTNLYLKHPAFFSTPFLLTFNIQESD